jgi:hypothetical protein
MSKRKIKDISCISQRTFRRRIATDFNASLQNDDNSLDEDLATNLPNTSYHEKVHHAVVPDSHQDHFFLNDSVNFQNSTSADSSFPEDYNNYISIDNSNCKSESIDEKLKT